MTDEKRPREDRFTWKEGDINILYRPPSKKNDNKEVKTEENKK